MIHPFVEQVKFHVCGTADGDPSRDFFFLAVPVRCDGRFRQTVELVNLRGRARPQLLLQFLGERFALGNDVP